MRSKGKYLGTIWLLFTSIAGYAQKPLTTFNAGHQVIADIAGYYLEPYARDSIKVLLGNQTLAEASSWADDALNQAAYKNTANWHYIILPHGLINNLHPFEFEQAVRAQQTANIYNAILKQEEIIKSTTYTRAQRSVALKFLINLVGDIHEPVYISNGIEPSNNTIQKLIDDKDRKQRSLLEDSLIRSQKLDYSDLAAKLYHQTPAIAKLVQVSDPIDWLKESYRAGENLYVNGDKSESIVLINGRLEMAGMRLGHLLNKLFEPPGDLHFSLADTAMMSPIKGPYWLAIPAQKAYQFIGLPVTLEGKVYQVKNYIDKVVLYLGGNYPDQFLSVVLNGKIKDMGPKLEGKMITVNGILINDHNKPELDIIDKANILIK